ncbi:MAG: hypothetical protein MR504_07115 [Methanobrevibacter woesei]|uniref:hypothetical protein n=1 Tax=Methanobrevibacter woesei TaxID=190976 RepID=UPI0023F32704|nr:hypothetical protein [Methanobrevibacter woesei]MCI7291945.1 hypothetical protein [Methanobrevibacter woesei]
MQKIHITNNHLRTIVNEVKNYLKKGQEMPEGLLFELMAELKVSNLLIPGFFDGDELITEHLTNNVDSTTVIPLYTDYEEYIKDYDLNSEYTPIPNDITYYIDLINKNNHNGIIVNFASESFFIPSDLLNNIPLTSIFSINDNFRGYGPNQLKSIAENTTNDSLVNFIKNPSNENNFDGLMMELIKSTLLNVIFDKNNLGNYSKNGIISIEDIGRFQVCIIGNDKEKFGILFTSKNAIINTMDKNSEFYYFYQITVLSEFFDYILRRDMDGVIINPGLDDYFIPRRVMLTFSNVTDNPNFKYGPNYAFLLK